MENQPFRSAFKNNPGSLPFLPRGKGPAPPCFLPACTYCWLAYSEHLLGIWSPVLARDTPKISSAQSFISLFLKGVQCYMREKGRDSLSSGDKPV